MSNAEAEETLSADDLKNRLYHSLREKGLVDSLKSQLRNKLILELRNVGLSRSLTVQPVASEERSLLHKAANSLVADHLRRCQYDYSYSVFLPESGTSEDKVGNTVAGIIMSHMYNCLDDRIFTTHDLLQLLNISPHSRLYKSLASSSSNYLKKGFLWQLLCEVAANHGHSCTHSAAQTDLVQLPPPQSTLEEKFRQLDKQYDSGSDDFGKGGRMAVEERILSYQRQLEERSRTEIQLEIARFKEGELSRVCLEEKEKARIELERVRKEMEHAYQAKSDGLVEREQNAIERLQKQQEIAEKETFAQRQSILEEIEAVRQREAALRRESEIMNRERILSEDKLKANKELLEKKEASVRQRELEYEQRLHDEITKFKLEEQARYLQRTSSLEVREGRVKEDERRLDEELTSIKQVKDELRDKRMRVNELEAELHKARHDLISSTKHSELMSEKLREMVDYQIIKEENAVLKRELESTKERLADIMKANMLERKKQEDLYREMTDRAGKPTPEVMLMQKEVERAREKLREEHALADYHRQQTETRMQQELDRNREIMKKYEEQTLQQREMAQEITDLRAQLLQTRQALNNEIYRKPKPSLIDRSGSFTDIIDDPVRDCPPVIPDLGSHDLYIDTLLARSTTEPELQFTRTPRDPRPTVGHRSGESSPDKTDDYSYSSDLIRETKERLRSLEKEAENLDHNYRDFQYRLTSVNTLPPEPVRSSPKRAQVSFIGGQQGTNTAAGPQTHPSRSAYTWAHRSDGSNGRPMSSTPTKDSRPASLHRPHTPPMQLEQEDKPLLNLSVSTVRSDSPTDLAGPKPVVTRSKPMTVSDLEARPGSPSVVVLPGSDGSPSDTPPNADRGTTEGGGGVTAAPASLDSAWKQPAVSLDSAWKTPTDTSGEDKRRADEEKRKREEEERRRREEEDREYEERRRRREEERRRQEQEAWEREQRELEELKRQEEKRPEPAAAPEKEKPKEEEKKEEAGEAGIDPVMQKYMAMVQQAKEREKKEAEDVTKKVVDTWQKGRKKSVDRSPSQSEDISAAEEAKSTGGGMSEDDFEW